MHADFAYLPSYLTLILWLAIYLAIREHKYNPWAKAQKFLGSGWIAMGADGFVKSFISFVKRVLSLQYLKWRMLDHCCSY